MRKHSRTPWIMQPTTPQTVAWIYDANAAYIATAGNDADAEIIIRAVNSFDALVTSLVSMTAIVEDLMNDLAPAAVKANDMGAHHVITKAKAALALAKE